MTIFSDYPELKNVPFKSVDDCEKAEADVDKRRADAKAQADQFEIEKQNHINIIDEANKELSKAIESLKNAKEESNKILAEARDKVNDLMAPLEQDVQEKQRALRDLQISYNKKYANSSPKYYVSVVRTVRPIF